jgi:hypothetical protein
MAGLLILWFYLRVIHIKRTAVRVSQFDFSQGTEGKAKGRETASRRSTGGFNNGLE